MCGRSISFLVIFESNVRFETVFGGLWEHLHISDSWKYSFRPFGDRRHLSAAASGLGSRRSNKSGGTQKICTSPPQKRPPPFVGAQFHFWSFFSQMSVLKQSSEDFENIHTFQTPGNIHYILKDCYMWYSWTNLLFLTKPKPAFDETEAFFWVITHFGLQLHLFSEPTYPLFNA